MSIKSDFFDYIGPADSLTGYQRSYKLVFLMSIIMNMDSSGGARFYDVVNSFRIFYLGRKLQGRVPDIDVDSRIADIEHSSITQIWAVIKDNPYKVISEKGYIQMGEGKDKRSFSLPSELHAQMLPKDYERLMSLIQHKLKMYYSKIDTPQCELQKPSHTTDDLLSRLDRAEAYYRERHMLAIDLDDLDQVQMIQREAWEKIRKIKIYRSELLKLYDEISKSGLLNIPDVVQVSILPGIVSCMDNEERYSQQETAEEDEGHNIIDDCDTVSTSPPNKTTIDPPPGPIYEGNPTQLILLGSQTPIHQWKDILLTVCEEMILRKPYAAAKFDINEKLNPNGQVIFSSIQSNIRSEQKRLSNGLWIETDHSAEKIISLCTDMLKICGYRPDDMKTIIQEVS